MMRPWRRGSARPVAKTPDDAMTLTEHLAELRVRIIRSALAIVVGAILILAFYDPVLEFLLQPYENLCERRGPEFCGLSYTDDGERQALHARPRSRACRRGSGSRPTAGSSSPSR